MFNYKLLLPSIFLLLTLNCSSTPEYKGENRTAEEFTILTYNVLASEDDGNLRAAAILTLLEKSDADVIALQEAAPWFIQQLEKATWLHKYHRIQVPDDFEKYKGVYLLSKIPVTVQFVTLPGPQKKIALLGRMVVNHRKTQFINVHLESPLDFNLTRALQLGVIRQHVDDVDEVFLLGDFNFGASAFFENFMLPGSFKDVWSKLHPADDGFTWDMDRNSLARKNAYPKEKNRRLDRILFKSDIFSACEVSLVGTSEIGANLYPSDHFGLLARFRRNCAE